MKLDTLSPSGGWHGGIVRHKLLSLALGHDFDLVDCPRQDYRFVYNNLSKLNICVLLLKDYICDMIISSLLSLTTYMRLPGMSSEMVSLPHMVGRR
jgi:hypothetical protein